jgi:hypothetical protein
MHKNPIIVHTAVVARFVLNDSKRNALQLLYTIYYIRCSTELVFYGSVRLRVHEIPTPTTERKFFDLHFGRMEFVHLTH